MASSESETPIKGNTSSSMTSSSSSFSAIPLKPVVKDYAWGIRGMDSRVGRYALTSGSIDAIDPDCPYAECKCRSTQFILQLA